MPSSIVLSLRIPHQVRTRHKIIVPVLLNPITGKTNYSPMIAWDPCPVLKWSSARRKVVVIKQNSSHLKIQVGHSKICHMIIVLYYDWWPGSFNIYSMFLFFRPFYPLCLLCYRPFTFLCFRLRDSNHYRTSQPSSCCHKSHKNVIPKIPALPSCRWSQSYYLLWCEGTSVSPVTVILPTL